jgi:periplasmic protein CpxP/Spy
MRALQLVAGGLFLITSALGAQRADSGRRALGPRVRAEIRAGRAGRAAGQRPNRLLLEGRARQALFVAVQRQLKLDDSKMQKLQQTDAKFDPERRNLTRDEREARQALKAAMEDSTSPDQATIDASMKRVLAIQHRRVELLEAEQNDLATFLTPKQRAQYFAIRERVIRRMAEMEQDDAGGGRRGVPPPL